MTFESPFEKGGTRGICLGTPWENPPSPPFLKGGILFTDKLLDTNASVSFQGKPSPLPGTHQASAPARHWRDRSERSAKREMSRIAGRGRPGPYGRVPARARGAFQLRCAEHRGGSPRADCRTDHTRPCARGVRAIRDCLTAPTRAGPVTRPRKTPGPAPPLISGSLWKRSGAPHGDSRPETRWPPPRSGPCQGTPELRTGCQRPAWLRSRNRGTHWRNQPPWPASPCYPPGVAASAECPHGTWPAGPPSPGPSDLST